MTVVVERPIHDVFEFCRDFANFPDIMDTLLSVEDSQDGRSHWAVRSPSGHTIEWDATVTKYVPNSVIAWASVPGSAVKASGTMRFSPLSSTETRVDVTVSYHPLQTDLVDALRSLVARRNSERLRADVINVTRELARPLPTAVETPSDAEETSEDVATRSESTPDPLNDGDAR